MRSAAVLHAMLTRYTSRAACEREAQRDEVFARTPECRYKSAYASYVHAVLRLSATFYYAAISYYIMLLEPFAVYAPAQRNSAALSLR